MDNTKLNDLHKLLTQLTKEQLYELQSDMSRGELIYDILECAEENEDDLDAMLERAQVMAGEAEPHDDDQDPALSLAKELDAVGKPVDEEWWAKKEAGLDPDSPEFDQVAWAIYTDTFYQVCEDSWGSGTPWSENIDQAFRYPTRQAAEQALARAHAAGIVDRANYEIATVPVRKGK